MSDSQIPPQIFDRALLKTRRGRAARRSGSSFLMDRCAQDCADRLMDVNRRFGRALLIAPAKARSVWTGSLPLEKLPTEIISAYFTDRADGLDQVIDDENLPFEAESFDLVISLLSLHAVNDLPGTLIQIRRILKPDGLFIGALFGGRTLGGLRQSAYQADETFFDGLTPRVFPFPDYTQIAALLQRAGFALPVVDTDRVSVSYATFERLLDDIRDLGDMNMLKARDHRPLSPAYLKFLKNYYSKTFVNEAGNLQAQFEILWATGWSPHHSQQKPLKPGSAEISLTQVLGKTEDP